MKGVLLFSGGVDSTTALAQLCAEGNKPYCLCFDYGQKARGELDAVMALLKYYDVEGEIAILPSSWFKGSAMTGDKPLPKDVHYRDQSHEATVVPARNLIFVALAVAEAQRKGLKVVYTGAHAPPISVYKDATPFFCGTLNRVTKAAYGVELRGPLLGMTKTDIVKVARSLAVPLYMTWSCYEAGSEPCGRCGQCWHRTEALAIPADPTA